MTDPPRVRKKQEARAILGLSLLAAACLLGSAVAQQGSAGDGVAREDLFGSLPEPPTESGPALPVLDEAGPASALLQAPEAAFAQWPRDGRGKPDWVRALRDGAIQPRAEVRGDGAMQVLDLDIVMKNTAQMPYVRFPHQAHALWLACSNCHDALFAPKAGANAITMSGILRGETCGVCHGTVAFTALFTCERCHSVLQPGQQRWW